MERLNEILKRERTPRDTSEESTATSSATSLSEGATAENLCPICAGRGWVGSGVPLGHPDFGRAVPCRCTLERLEGHKLERLQQYSNLGALSKLTFDNFSPRGKDPEPLMQERFRRCYEACLAYASAPEGWLLLSGPSGCGKTHLAAAIANLRIQQGHPAFFVFVPDLLDHLKAAFSPDSPISYDKLFEQVREAPLLILDDLGVQNTTPWSREKLYQVLNHRYAARLPTVVTTRLNPDHMEDPLRTRLTDPSLVQVLFLGRGPLPSLDTLSLELPSRMTFDKFDTSGMNLTGEKRANLHSAYETAKDHAEHPDGWLVFTGTHGCGKTHLAAAIANNRRAKGDEVAFVVVPELLDFLRSAFSPESRTSYGEAFDRIKTVHLLVLDDYGKHASTPWAMEKLYQLLNYRYNARLPTIITSSYGLDEINQFEPGIASRMADPRVSLVLAIMAPSYRSDERPDSQMSRPKGIAPRAGRPRQQV